MNNLCYKLYRKIFADISLNDCVNLYYTSCTLRKHADKYLTWYITNDINDNKINDLRKLFGIKANTSSLNLSHVLFLFRQLYDVIYRGKGD